MRCISLVVLLSLGGCFHVGKKPSLIDVPYSVLLIGAALAGGDGGNLDIHDDRVTRISGRVVVPDGGEVRFEELQLVRGERVKARTATDGGGKFEFAGEIEDGPYEIRLVSDRFHAVEPVTVMGFAVSNVEIAAQPL